MALGPTDAAAVEDLPQFTPGSRTTLRILPPPDSDREYTPARSADRHRPEAHRRRASILSPAVTATGTTFWAAYERATAAVFSGTFANSFANSGSSEPSVAEGSSAHKSPLPQAVPPNGAAGTRTQDQRIKSPML